MNGPSEQLYCSQQILVPPRFPHMLKTYAKDAIKTQPFDLLRWSASYFRCLAEAKKPPAKTRIEIPPTAAQCGLTPGFLKVLLHQFGTAERVNRDELFTRWMGVCLCEYELMKMLLIGNFFNLEDVPWMQFFAIAVGYLNKSLTHTMIMICELLTEEPDGGSAMIPLWRFQQLYKFLANLDCSASQRFRNGRRILLKPNPADPKGPPMEYLETPPDTGVVNVSSDKTEAVREATQAMANIQQEKSSSKEDFYVTSAEIITEAIEEEAKPFKSDLKIVASEELMLITKMDLQEDVELPDELEINDIVEEKQLSNIAEIKLVETDKEDQQEVELEVPSDLIFRREENGQKGGQVEYEEKLAKNGERPQDEGLAEGGKSSELSVQGSPEISDEKISADGPKKVQEQDDQIAPENGNLNAYPAQQTEIVEQESVEGEDQYPGCIYQESDTGAGACTCLEEESRSSSTSDGDLAELAKASKQQPKRDYTKMLRTYSKDIMQVPAIPGIGGRVPEELQQEVLIYLTNISRKQRGMVMPRNLRHYLCPPLEELNACPEEGRFEDTAVIKDEED